MAQFYMKFHNSTCKNTQYKSLKQWFLIGAADNFRIPHSPQKGKQLVAQATGCFRFPAAAKLAWMTMEAENSQ